MKKDKYGVVLFIFIISIITDPFKQQLSLKWLLMLYELHEKRKDIFDDPTGAEAHRSCLDDKKRNI